jgi:glutamyl-tRNA(Gln) amidotransferase subunit E
MSGFDEHDYEELGLVAGLEIHQQLDTETKLFCGCPTERREPDDAVQEITRYLHPTRSELGELDAAAIEESRVSRRFSYLAYDTTCLVEADDEPPHRIDDEAIEVALEIASLLSMRPVDTARIMRKIVVDGSNTSGFQRSSLLATGGEIDTENGPVGIEDLLLEEESAARIEETDEGTRYGLDRLGIPLVEIGTAPDIRSPSQAREAAATIGMLLRSTRSVKRGLGTIRQDVNVSIADGARVEIKGVQALDDIDDIVRNEVARQQTLLDVREELDERDASVGEPTDVSDVFDDTDSGVIAGALGAGGRAMAVCLRGFDGLVGKELQPDRRLGTEFADHARRHGAGGVFHTDELPAYGISDTEVEALREAVDAGEDDAVALVADDPETAETAIEAVAERARTAIDGVPEETRGANAEGTTQYLRPLPGAARMYPETDVPPVPLDFGEIEPPEVLTETVDRFEGLGLDRGLAEQVAYGRRVEAFERAIDMGIDPALAARTVESTTTELRRDGVPVENLDDGDFEGVFSLVANEGLPNEGVPEVLRALANDPELSASEAAEQAGVGATGESEVRETVAEVVERNEAQVREEGMGAFSGLMGEAMGALRGKADGEVVSDALREEISQRTE